MAQPNPPIPNALLKRKRHCPSCSASSSYGMARDGQRVFIRMLLTFEGIAYSAIAFALCVPVVMLVIYTWAIFP